MLKKVILLLVGCLIFQCSTPKKQTISIVEVVYQNTPHFKIETPAATYFLEKGAGGFSSILDTDGVDWIQFKKTENPSYPAAAAADYRGIPNMVYRSDDGGCGHPGFDKCTSVQVNDSTIRTTSKSGVWQWTWTFTPAYAFQTLERVDPHHSYWFLYEGPIAGRFEPAQQYWGTNRGGPRVDQPDYFQNWSVYGSWQWVYFGDNRVNRVLFLAQNQDDDITDTFGYLGNTEKGLDSPDGMVVFGFGREKNAHPLLTQAENVFYLGFYEAKIADKTAHLEFEEYVEGIVR